MENKENMKQTYERIAAYGKKLQELAVSSVGKWVIAGYAGYSQKMMDFYCYCGEGNGYKGAPLIPANARAVLYSQKQAALQKLEGMNFQNGRSEQIHLKVMPANEYFWQLFDDCCISLHQLEELKGQ